MNDMKIMGKPSEIQTDYSKLMKAKGITMDNIRNKILNITGRVEIAAKGQRNTDDWHDAEDNLSAPDNMSYWDWIEDAEKDALYAFVIRDAQLTQLNKELVDLVNDMAKQLGNMNYGYSADIRADMLIERAKGYNNG